MNTAIELAIPRPTDLEVCVLGVDCPAPQPGPFEPNYHRFRLDWVVPSFGTIRRYDVYRQVGNVAAQLVGSVARVGLEPPATTFIDSEELPNGVTFIYTVLAIHEDGTVNGAASPPSDPERSRVAVNTPPVALPDSYQTTKNTLLTVPAPGVLTNDIASPTFDVDSPPTSSRLSASRARRPAARSPRTRMGRLPSGRKTDSPAR